LSFFPRPLRRFLFRSLNGVFPGTYLALAWGRFFFFFFGLRVRNLEQPSGIKRVSFFPPHDGTLSIPSLDRCYRCAFTSSVLFPSRGEHAFATGLWLRLHLLEFSFCYCGPTRSFAFFATLSPHLPPFLLAFTRL